MEQNSGTLRPGLTVRDFELLVSLGVFNSALMNDAVFKFKRYEDSSLTYTGIDKHEGEEVGLSHGCQLCEGGRSVLLR